MFHHQTIVKPLAVREPDSFMSSPNSTPAPAIDLGGLVAPQGRSFKSRSFDEQLRDLRRTHEALLNRPNEIDRHGYQGVFHRYLHPVVTAETVPLDWRFDLNEHTNPGLSSAKR